jgi:5-methylcytosine-specific restriction endonuclease McrA
MSRQRTKKMSLTKLPKQLATLDTRVGAPVAVQRIRGGRLKKIRERIAIRDEYRCQMCGRVTAHGEVDHKMPLHLGGQETDENRWWLCVPCHKLKSEQEGHNRE